MELIYGHKFAEYNTNGVIFYGKNDELFEVLNDSNLNNHPFIGVIFVPSSMEVDKKAAEKTVCFHCGDKLPRRPVKHSQRAFCCSGCATVFELLSASGMEAYYHLEDRPGLKAGAANDGRFAYLDLPEIQERLLRFQDGNYARVTLRLPAIHCSSCIWLLENLHKLHAGVKQVSVSFTRKEASILFKTKDITLRELAEFLVKLGYSPDINLATFESQPPRISKELYYKIGIAGFSFGNIMLLSLPEYLGMGEGWESYARFFGYLNILLALPVFFYASSDYYRSAWASVRNGKVNIDVPITLGIFALFGRSLYEILSGVGAGYMDSLAGLLFFLLIGKWFQEKTFQSLSFDRKYDSYFPVAATVIENGLERQVPLKNLMPGMEILVRNQELIPADSDLLSEEATIDFSFVTGESDPVHKEAGAFVYAGGRQSGPAIRLRVRQRVDQSYLTELWNQQAFSKPDRKKMLAFIDVVSRRFTFIILFIALAGAIYWWFEDPTKVALVVTAVLIVACPCALALSAPFSFGHTLRVLGNNRFYLRNADTIERMAGITDIVFDKTGTLTHANQYSIQYQGKPLSDFHKQGAALLASQSNHPLSRAIANFLGDVADGEISRFREVPGGGLQAMVDGKWVVLGSERFVTGESTSGALSTRVFLKVGEELAGFFEMSTAYRDQFERTLKTLGKGFDLHLLSGDNDSEQKRLSTFIQREQMFFNQSPFDKLQYIEKLQQNNRMVLMIGDGLNDAGALQAADVGVSVADNVYAFTPACDAIFDGAGLAKLPEVIGLARHGLTVVKWSIGLSFAYNVIGLSFALTGMLTPLVAAILMPVSSISVVVLTTVAVRAKAHKLGIIQTGGRE